MDYQNIEEILTEIKARMKKAIQRFENDLKTVRTGRANPGVLDNVYVDYYGASTPLSQAANITVPDPRTLMIAPWDKSILHEIEKAIQESDLGLPPNNDGKVIRLNFPQLTEEVRKEMVRTVRKKAEDARVQVRNIRRDGNGWVKKIEPTEDEEKEHHEAIQKVTDKTIRVIDDTIKEKESELTTI